MRAALSWAALAAALLTAPLRAEEAFAPGVGAPAQQDLYLDALQAINEGRRDDGGAALERMIAQGPRHAGEWLDLALIHCALGQGEQAERLFEAIEARFAPPPGIRDIIAQQRAQGCAGRAARSQWSLLAARGHDQNVNQGAASPFFTPGSGPQLQLLPEYLPHADGYSVLTGDYARDLGPPGGGVFAQLQARRNDTLSAYNTASAFGGVDRLWSAARWRLRGAGLLGALWLGGRLYQEQGQLQLRATPPLALPAGLELQLVGGVSHVSYKTQSQFDSNTGELRAVLDYRAGARQAQLGAARLNDHATGGRPGGDRSGWSVNLGGRAVLYDKLVGELDWTRLHWQGASAYAPGLIDSIRRQDMRSVRAALSYPVSEQSTLQLEWRQVNNHENISIFQYNSRQLQLSWHWRGGQ